MSRQDAKIAKKIRVCVLVLMLSACAVVRAPEHVRIALFASFEGRYREIGYNALYAARLALKDAGNDQLDLLAVDSGGPEAANHAKALTVDPLVMAAVVLGYDGTTPDVLRAFGDIPVLVVGDWGAQPTSDNVFIFSNPQIDAQLTVSPSISVEEAAQADSPVIGGDVFALEGFAKLRSSLDGVTILSTGILPDADFAKRYQNGDPFAPKPGLLATLSYDATGIAINAVQTGTRESAREMIGSTAYDGINGLIRFENGYWVDAPIHTYHYVDGSLTENVVK